jgi:GNAT superfamily N-acetyltransferase
MNKEGSAVFSSTTPYVESLGHSLILKSLSTPDQIERLAHFNSVIHDQLDPGDFTTSEHHTGDLTRVLIERHPQTHPDHWLFVEHEDTGQIIAALCLIPWVWRYEHVELKVGEMGIVGTLPDYRRKGLIRALDRRFKTLLNEGEYDLSPIQGIPFFYRLLGYEYALPLEGGWHLHAYQIPRDLPSNAQGYTFRRATLDDLPELVRLYDDAACDLAISAVRSPDVWRFLLEHEPDTATASETWLVLDANGRSAGYWRLEKFGFGEGLTIGEASRLSQPAAVAVLNLVKTLAAERGKPYLKLSCADSHTLVAVAKAWGAQNTGRYAWQLLIPDPARLLRKIAPVLERRIAVSPFAGLTETICLNLYREAFELRFEDGRISSVEAVGFRDWGNLSLPPQTLAPMIFGYRSREELHAVYPDVCVWGQHQYLMDTLFPKMTAFIYTQY